MRDLTPLASFLALCLSSSSAWVSVSKRNNHPLPQCSSTSRTSLRSAPMMMSAGSLHGENACFLPLKQLDQDYYAPRIIQIAGAYPGLSREDFYAVTSEPAAVEGQWSYDFSDPEGPQLGTVAVEGSNIVAACEDPVAIIAEHPSIGMQLPEAIKDPVDLIVLVDRAENTFAERAFMVLDTGNGLQIAAFPTKQDLPANAEILGRVKLVTVPWLPAMAPTRTGFMEADEYY